MEPEDDTSNHCVVKTYKKTLYHATCIPSGSVLIVLFIHVYEGSIRAVVMPVSAGNICGSCNPDHTHCSQFVEYGKAGNRTYEGAKAKPSSVNDT